jgi:mitogen-activated protein kinase 1/3
MYKSEYNSIRKLVSEIELLRNFSSMSNNMHTSALLDVITEPNLEGDWLFLVMEYFPSDLKKVLNRSSTIEFNEDHVLIITYNIICAINYIHSAGIMHRDIKPANILIDDNCQIKICDFGFSRTKPSTLILP